VPNLGSLASKLWEEIEVTDGPTTPTTLIYARSVMKNLTIHLHRIWRIKNSNIRFWGMNPRGHLQVTLDLGLLKNNKNFFCGDRKNAKPSQAIPFLS